MGSPPGPRPSTPTTRPSPRRRTPVTVTPVRRIAPAWTAASCRRASRAYRRGATRWSTPARSLIRRTVCSSPVPEQHLADRGRTGACTAVEQSPAGQLDDAASGDAVGRDRVAREGRPVQQQHVVPGSGQQHRGRRPGAPGADDDDLVPVEGGVHSRRLCAARRPGCLTNRWRPGGDACGGRSPGDRQTTTTRSSSRESPSRRQCSHVVPHHCLSARAAPGRTRIPSGDPRLARRGPSRVARRRSRHAAAAARASRRSGSSSA